MIEENGTVKVGDMINPTKEWFEEKPARMAGMTEEMLKGILLEIRAIELVYRDNKYEPLFILDDFNDLILELKDVDRFVINK